VGHGAYGAAIDASDPRRMRVGDAVHCGGSDVFVQAIKTVNSAMTSDMMERAYRVGPGITTASERVGVEAWGAATEMTATTQILDCASVVAVDDAGRGCMVIAPLDRVHLYPRRVTRVWSRVIAHIVAMHRLRRALSGASGKGRAADGEAVLSPGARIEHAEGAAKEPSALALLREAAIARERARSRRGRRDPDEALEMWRALVGGRWSIVDRFDHDGRRFLIAHENDPEASGPRALSRRERQVVTRVGMGHSNKLIAYELGLATGAVSAYLHAAMTKLGLGSRIDIARVSRAAWMAR